MILPLQDRDGFRLTSLTYNKVVDENIHEIVKVTRNRSGLPKGDRPDYDSNYSGYFYYIALFSSP
jgi:hypothetical protein